MAKQTDGQVSLTKPTVAFRYRLASAPKNDGIHTNLLKETDKAEEFCITADKQQYPFFARGMIAFFVSITTYCC